MKDEIENYEPRQPIVEKVGVHTVRAWVGGSTPAIGDTLWIGNIPARIDSLLEQREVKAVVFDSSAISVGDRVTVSDETASLPSPREGLTELHDLAFEPGEDAERADASTERGRLTTGIDEIDSALPLVRGGVNVVLDASDDPAPFERLVRASGLRPLVTAAARKPGFEFSHGITWEDEASMPLAMRVATNWASRTEDAALVVETSLVDLDALTAGLGDHTVLARLLLPEGLDAIAETLDLGMADCQIFLREDGTVDLLRSHSRLAEGSEWPQMAARTADIRESMAIFGTDELEDDERRLLEDVDRMERALLT